LPSASSLRYIQQHAIQATNNGAVVFGNPATKETGLPTLPFAAAEADAVAKTLGVSDFTGKTATELQLRESVKGAAILHMAAHGAYNQHNPLYSVLYLAPDADGKYDGRLEVHEIFGLNLKGSQLVVLSACETQIGQLSTGDEVVGMTRAFMFAGSPSVLASLWRVDDEATQALMTAFYKHWREEGMNKAEALQAAQAEVRANPKWQSPYYWAAFVLSGDVGKLAKPAGNPTSTPPPASNPSGTTCPGMILAPVAFMIMVFATKRRPSRR
jgi:CHAT domain-containing protein